MKKVTYRGLANEAIISGEDWEGVGLSSKEVRWSGYGDTQEIANDAADYLARHDDRFEVEGASESAFAQRLQNPEERAADERRRARQGASSFAPLTATAPRAAPTE